MPALRDRLTVESFGRCIARGAVLALTLYACHTAGAPASAACSSALLERGVASNNATVGPGCWVEPPMLVFGDLQILEGGGTESYVALYDDATLTMRGGQIGSYLRASGNSEVHLIGGTIDSYISITGDSSLYVYGVDLSYEPVRFSSSLFIGTLNGTLLDGSPLNYSLRMSPGAKLHFIVVPEPSAALLAASLTLATSAAPRRRRVPALRQ